MKRRVCIVVLILVIAAAWAYCDLKSDPSPLYIPGRDTMVYWNDGACEIIGKPGFNSLYVGGTQVTGGGDFVAAYKKVGNEVFFITEKGRIAVNLETVAYTAYMGEKPSNPAHAAMFADEDSFEWLSKYE